MAKRRTSRITANQLKLLVDFMEANSELRIGKIDENFTKSDRKRKYQELADLLNDDSLGARKTIAQWHKCWNDQKRCARSKLEEIKKQKQQTGGRRIKIKLTAMEKKILAISGNMPVADDQSVNEDDSVDETDSVDVILNNNKSGVSQHSQIPGVFAALSESSIAQPIVIAPEPASYVSQPSASVSQPAASTSLSFASANSLQSSDLTFLLTSPYTLAFPAEVKPSTQKHPEVVPLEAPHIQNSIGTARKQKDKRKLLSKATKDVVALMHEQNAKLDRIAVGCERICDFLSELVELKKKKMQLNR